MRKYNSFESQKHLNKEAEQKMSKSRFPKNLWPRAFGLSSDASAANGQRQSHSFGKKHSRVFWEFEKLSDDVTVAGWLSKDKTAKRLIIWRLDTIFAQFSFNFAAASLAGKFKVKLLKLLQLLLKNFYLS